MITRWLAWRDSIEREIKAVNAERPKLVVGSLIVLALDDGGVSIEHKAKPPFADQRVYVGKESVLALGKFLVKEWGED